MDLDCSELWIVVEVCSDRWSGIVIVLCGYL